MTSTGDVLSEFIEIDDLEREVFDEIFAVFDYRTHFNGEMNCDEMAGDKPRKPLHKTFSIKCKF